MRTMVLSTALPCLPSPGVTNRDIVFPKMLYQNQKDPHR
jgi:hypothetical protein